MPSCSEKRLFQPDTNNDVSCNKKLRIELPVINQDVNNSSISESAGKTYTAGDIERIRYLRRQRRTCDDFSNITDEDIIIDERKNDTTPQDEQGDNSTAFRRDVIKSQDSPKMEPFNMEEEMKFGQFDESGYFQFSSKGTNHNRVDSEDDGVSDAWLNSLSEIDPGSLISNEQIKDNDFASTKIKRPIPREGPSPEDILRTKDTRTLLMNLIGYLEAPNETPAAALRRIKLHSKNDSRLNTVTQSNTNLKKIKNLFISHKMTTEQQELFDSITDHCNVLMLSRGIEGILTTPRNELLQLMNKETTNPTSFVTNNNDDNASLDIEDTLWKFKWKQHPKADSSQIHGPCTNAQLYEWIQSGYINKKTPVDVLEVTASGDPVDGIWHDWSSINFNPNELVTEIITESQEIQPQSSEEDVSESDEEVDEVE